MARRTPAPRSKPSRSTPRASLAYARQVLTQEAQAIASLGSRLGHDFLLALEALHLTKGRVVCTGIGKPGFIAQKLDRKSVV